MNLPLVVASIVARVKAKNGVVLDEAHLSDALQDAMVKLRTENETEYLQIIAALTKEVEILSRHVGNLRHMAHVKNASHGNG